ncbi:VOC family protein [Paraglaciecola hydrolytica]|uniref:Glyoxalase/fosfomycin resistance/dioxygenase domain-containing protein n=1 Tax=Paraglaciecola hydrolytica TaxID=1799789 RepID=A0A148KLU4_9ALTE|nr:VOC family protein [Paraglaciecola hydrolytica]KXI27218.1 hypothetical protein AX660_01225 [Paraglaciecola hydrolytica]
MRLSIHVHFDGRCQEAFELYEKLLGGKIGTMLPFGKSPAAASVPATWQTKIVHANIQLAGVEIAGDDIQPEQYEPPRGFYILLAFENEDKTRLAFEGLSEKGKILFPLQKTFWSPCYGIVVDQYGVPWKLNSVA